MIYLLCSISVSLCYAQMNASSTNLSFGQFLNEFPLPSIDLHFRFRRDDPACGYVWQDMASHGDIVPTFQGSIFVKILRLGDASALRRKSRLKLKQQVIQSGGSFNRSAPPMSSGGRNKTLPHATSAIPEQNRSSSSSNSGVNVNAEDIQSTFGRAHDDDTFSPPVVETPVTVEPNMFSEFDAPVVDDAPTDGSYVPAPISRTNKKYVTTNAYVPHDDDIDDGPYVSPSDAASASPASVPVPAPAPVIDFMSDMTGNATGGGVEPAASSGKSEALEFKRALDRKREQEAEDGDESRKKLQGVMTKWATNNGEKRNIRTLLSTLHTVITWTNWKPLSLGDLMEAKKVKLHYRKAMVIVHPDKNSSFNSDQKYQGQRAFEVLNEAYNEFETKESVA